MKYTFSLILFITFLQTAEAQSTKESFIPENYTLLHETTGDLNKDSIPDVAMIVEYSGDALEGERPRSLILLLKDKKTKLFTRAAEADHVILGGDMGGTLGDPFTGMEIRNNVLKIDFVGGSRERWSTTHRYRYTDNTYFKVIGATYTVEDQGVKKTYDYNLSNGNYIITTRDSQNKANNTTVNKKHLPQPITIEEFEPDAVWAMMDVPDMLKKTETCAIQYIGGGDCSHIVFDCGDFGNAKTFLTEEEYKLFSDLSGEGPEDGQDESNVNSEYADKAFELTYVNSFGLRCEPQGEDTYQLLIGFKLSPNAPVIPAIPAEGLYAYIDFNNTTRDKSPNNRKTIINGGQHTSDGTSPVGAYYFDGQSYLQIPQTTEKFKIPFTVSAWFSSNDERQLQTVVSLGRSADGTAFNFGYNYPEKNNAVYFGVIGTAPFGIEYEMPSSGWYHAAVTMDEKSIKLYVNGNHVTQKLFTPSEFNAAQRNLMSTTQPIEIGRELATLDRYFSGTIDNVALYSRALNAEEIWKMFEVTKGGK